MLITNQKIACSFMGGAKQLRGQNQNLNSGRVACGQSSRGEARGGFIYYEADGPGDPSAIGVFPLSTSRWR